MISKVLLYHFTLKVRLKNRNTSTVINIRAMISTISHKLQCFWIIVKHSFVFFLLTERIENQDNVFLIVTIYCCVHRNNPFQESIIEGITCIISIVLTTSEPTFFILAVRVLRDKYSLMYAFEKLFLMSNWNSGLILFFSLIHFYCCSVYNLYYKMVFRTTLSVRDMIKRLA
jgi:hypothetical protein